MIFTAIANLGLVILFCWTLYLDIRSRQEFTKALIAEREALCSALRVILRTNALLDALGVATLNGNVTIVQKGGEPIYERQ